MTEKMRFEGLTLTVDSVEKSIEFYDAKLGLEVEYKSLPAFAMLRHGAGTIGLPSIDEAKKEGVEPASAAQKHAIHVEFTTDDLYPMHEERSSRDRRAAA